MGSFSAACLPCWAVDTMAMGAEASVCVSPDGHCLFSRLRSAKLDGVGQKPSLQAHTSLRGHRSCEEAPESDGVFSVADGGGSKTVNDDGKVNDSPS